MPLLFGALRDKDVGGMARARVGGDGRDLPAAREPARPVAGRGDREDSGGAPGSERGRGVFAACGARGSLGRSDVIGVGGFTYLVGELLAEPAQAQKANGIL